MDDFFLESSFPNCHTHREKQWMTCYNPIKVGPPRLVPLKLLHWANHSNQLRCQLKPQRTMKGPEDPLPAVITSYNNIDNCFYYHFLACY